MSRSGSYLGGSTVIGARSGWFTFTKKKRPLVVNTDPEQLAQVKQRREAKAEAKRRKEAEKRAKAAKRVQTASALRKKLVPVEVKRAEPPKKDPDRIARKLNERISKVVVLYKDQRGVARPKK
ncbi:hypothetical protein CXZ10_11295 [Pleomorphomonas diazotrophica]|uniref:Uncharacterized protein n=1 Tax=Pleomorphomonas diazotrophica TaxID=1166257 RepID=A0A1I4WJ57_9HYPH|nr:hypothetical protein [Pleomorphomonas diazotrophica]PKR89094.1 hypothetical protein CXZ10_11295 [Pleomorphomonas diazotrophica]SFN13262.1 hypothetical protein SAMN05192571_11744 [Pleomorphomonas diazotrophica]